MTRIRPPAVSSGASLAGPNAWAGTQDFSGASVTGIPTSLLTNRGAWAPSTAYVLGDIVTYNGAAFTIASPHTSGTSFDLSKWVGMGVVFDPRNYGAKCDAVTRSDGSTSGRTLTGSGFTTGKNPVQPGMKIVISGAGANNTANFYVSTVQSITDDTHLIVTATPTNNVASGATYTIGTDDSAAWAACITAATRQGGNGRRASIMLEGHSVIATPLTWASGLSLIGTSPVDSGLHFIGFASAASMIAFDGTATVPITDITIANCEFDGSGYSNTIYGVGMKALFMRYMLRPVITGNYIHNTPATGIGCDFLADAVITGNRVINCGQRNNGTTDLGGAGIGIAVGGLTGVNEGGVVDGNIVRGAKTFGIFYEGSAGATADTWKTINNVCVGNRDGIGDCGVKGGIYTGNHLRSNTRYGFVWNGGTSAGACGWETTVADNQITDNGSDGMFYDGAFASSTAANVSRIYIHSNRIARNAGAGVRVDVTTKNLSRFRIHDNSIHDNTGYGVSFTQSSGTALLSSVRIVDNEFATNTAGVVNYGIVPSDLYVAGNAGINFGTGTPEGAIAAPIGSTYARQDGGAGTSFYVKESGTAAVTTGWVGK